jgi:hypothetical protein
VLPSPFFFSVLLALGMVADPKCRPDTVDLADTHTKVKTFSQDDLDGG